MRTRLKKSLDITDLGLLHFPLGMEVWQLDHGIAISQPMSQEVRDGGLSTRCYSVGIRGEAWFRRSVSYI